MDSEVHQPAGVVEFNPRRPLAAAFERRPVLQELAVAFVRVLHLFRVDIVVFAVFPDVAVHPHRRRQPVAAGRQFKRLFQPRPERALAGEQLVRPFAVPDEFILLIFRQMRRRLVDAFTEHVVLTAVRVLVLIAVGQVPFHLPTVRVLAGKIGRVRPAVFERWISQ